MKSQLFLLLGFLLAQEATSQVFLVPQDPDVILDPSNLTKTISGSVSLVEWYTTLKGAHHVTFGFQDPKVASLLGSEATFDASSLDGNATGQGSFNVSSDFVGFNLLNMTVFDELNNTLGTGHLEISVVLSYERLNKIFTYILTVLIFCVYINMGATIDLTVVKQIVKRPVGPAVGIVCQYLLMPVISFGLAKLFFPDNKLLQLGMFLNGASPGGGSSNMWTFLLGGSLDLSIMMTFASTVFAFGAVPLWVLTLGPQIIGEDSSFQIPYDDIALLIVSLIVPCSLGILIQKFIPKLAKFLEKRVLAPFSIFNILFIFSFGIYSHRYVFEIFDWSIMLACFFLPGLGYLSGFVISFLAKRTWREIIAITIETGVQNANISIIILKFTLGSPAGDLAVVIPACGVIMTPIPLLIALIVKKTYARFVNSGGKDISDPNVAPKEGLENGSTHTMTARDDDSKPGEKRGEDTSAAILRTNGRVATHDKLFGVDNPTMDLANDVL